MKISSFRETLRQDEAGQAIIFGVVSMLVLAVGILTTAQLGWAIREKIQLQHAADNAAYSTATMVARSMNFIAWTNRATISQYVTAMSLQSMVTYFDGMVMLVAAGAATLYSAAFTMGIAAKILQAFIITAPIGAAIEAFARPMGGVAKALDNIATQFQNIVDIFDRVIAPAVFLIGEINYWVNYKIMQKLLGQGYILKNFADVAMSSSSSFFGRALEGTDDKFKMSDNTVYDVVNAGTDLIQYLSMFDKCSQKIGTTDDCSNVDDSSVDANALKNRAQGLMTDIVNASREGRNDGAIRNFESYRKFTASTVFEIVLSAIGLNASVGSFMSFLDPLFPSSHGGTLLAKHIPASDKAALGNHGGALTSDAGEIAQKKNPVFVDSVYRHDQKNVARPGDAIIAVQHIKTPGEGGIGGLLKRALNVISASGELFARDKIIGIQATNADSGAALHCHFSRLDVVAIDTSSMEEQCKEICGNRMKACNENCNKNQECHTEIKTKDDGTTEEVEVCNDVWTPKPSDDPNIEPSDCSQCATAAEADDEGGDDCPEAQQCIEGVRKAAKEAADAVGDVVSDIVAGKPARVLIECDDHLDRSKIFRHRFRGVSPYVSFNIQRYEQKQSKNEDPYPSYAAATRKALPYFLGEDAPLGFGNKSLVAPVVLGKVDGAGGSSLSAQCEVSGEACLNEYNYDHLHNGNTDFLGTKGFHAWSRSQVYYHRPGAWAEPPNLFNPYWKAKLAPVGPVFSEMLEGILGNMPFKVEDILLH